MKPLAIDLFAGLGGWAEGFLAEGWDVIGFDNHRHVYGDQKYPAQLVLQDVLTLDGRQFRNASVIVASPPCQEFSYMAMPWSRAKQIAGALCEEVPFPEPYTGSRTIEDLTRLFRACFRIAKEAGVPLVVENVKGAQPWVGQAKANYGSFYLWGDIGSVGGRITGQVPRFGETVQAKGRAAKIGGPVGDDWFVHHNRQEFFDRANGHKNARNWWSDGEGNLSATTSSHSAARKAASAQIAKIPFALASHIARVYKPC